MKRAKSLFIVALLVVFAAAIAIAAEKGAEKITVDGGSKGAVNFPHKVHQDELKDCNICHATFPQELESIKKLKDKKELKKMQVMNEVCLKCHKGYKAEGKPKYGPINCNGCHGK